jgi:hypothetical protein
VDAAQNGARLSEPSVALLTRSALTQLLDVRAQRVGDFDTWVGEVKRIRGEKLSLTAAPSGWRFLLSALPISAFQPTRPRPCRRNPETGAQAQG